MRENHLFKRSYLSLSVRSFTLIKIINATFTEYFSPLTYCFSIVCVNISYCFMDHDIAYFLLQLLVTNLLYGNKDNKKI